MGQENTARIKLKNKLNKRLLPVQVIDGIIESESISINNKEIGKILIKNKNPFAIIKINDQNFDFDEIFDWV